MMILDDDMEELVLNIRKISNLDNVWISNFDAEAYLYESVFREFYGFYRNFEPYITHADACVYDLDMYPSRIYTIEIHVRADPKDIQEMMYYTERMNGVY